MKWWHLWLHRMNDTHGHARPCFSWVQAPPWGPCTASPSIAWKQIINELYWSSISGDFSLFYLICTVVTSFHFFFILCSPLMVLVAFNGACHASIISPFPRLRPPNFHFDFWFWIFSVVSIASSFYRAGIYNEVNEAFDKMAQISTILNGNSRHSWIWCFLALFTHTQVTHLNMTDETFSMAIQGIHGSTAFWSQDFFFFPNNYSHTHKLQA